MPRRLSLSCRQFRRLHAEYTDGLLSGEVTRACQAHLDGCAACERHDVMIRRSLLALQALPVVELSAGFGDRLAARLARESIDYTPAPTMGVRWGVATAILAASVALLVMAPPRSGTSNTAPHLATTAQTPVRVSTPELRAAQFSREQRTTSERVADAVERTQKATVNRAISARFEALPGEAPMRDAPLMLRTRGVRLQTVNYLGQ